MITFSPAIPILRIFSVDKAKEFYLDFLGFTLEWEHRFSADLPLYMQVSRAGLTLHLRGEAAFGLAFIATACAFNAGQSGNAGCAGPELQ